MICLRRLDSLCRGTLIPGLLLTSASWSCKPTAAAEAEILVPATDYAFQLPPEIKAGPTRFRMANNGKVPHELAMGQLKEGVSADSVMAYMGSGRDPSDLADGVVGILIADPGKTALGTLKAELIAGRTYLMICQFKDADSLPPHIVMGMQASFVAK